MFQAKEKIDRMRIASPCPKNWEGMTGDHRTRFCDLCSLHVYNISEMTRKEVETLISKTEGRICARLYKRSDGTVITKDCPVGLRAIRRRVSRVAGAVITTIFSFCLSVMGQSSTQEDKTYPAKAKITIERTQDSRARLRGVLIDVNGNAMPGFHITLMNSDMTSKLETVSIEEGLFSFDALEAGSYNLSVQANGLESFSVNQINIDTSQTVNIELQMIYVTNPVFVGMVSSEPLIETESPNVKKTFSPKQITTLPY